MTAIGSSQFIFPNPVLADPDGEGLIAIGADLAPATLLEAYRHGIFPWFNADDPICWWSPDPRCVIYPAQFWPSKSLQRQLNKNRYTLTLNQCFTEVVTACAQPRAYADDTWISQGIIDGYSGLHDAGLAYSVEVWQNHIGQPELVGGLYGVRLGQAFFGESMFSRQTDVSKMAFCFLMRLCHASNFSWVDCQLPNDHLMSLGATTLPRADFLHQLHINTRQAAPNWKKVIEQRFDSSYILSDHAFLDLI